MIEFFSQIDFELENSLEVAGWIEGTAASYDFTVGDLTYVFCSDDQLHKINLEFLSHDTYTDIITFNYNLHQQINGEAYISIDRVKENAITYNQTFINELHRVIIHGLLHLCGLKDKEDIEITAMRRAEDQALASRRFI